MLDFTYGREYNFLAFPRPGNSDVHAVADLG
jgi:hypothetical protein